MLRTENVSGYENTMTLVEKGSDKSFPTAYKAWNYKPAGPKGTTGWFLPTAQQWIRMTMGLGGVTEDDIRWGDKSFDNDLTAINKWEAALEKAGEGNYESIKILNALWRFLTSSENAYYLAVVVTTDVRKTGKEYGSIVGSYSKTYAEQFYCVRPVLAF